MNVGIAAGHCGFVLKQRLVKSLREDGYEVVDFGAVAWDLVQTFLGARFGDVDRQRRQLAKLAELEKRPDP